MIIKYLGHSCFQLTESTGTTIVCDPYSSEVGFSMPEVRADAVTISHHHFDHDNLKAVKGNPIVLDKESSFDLPGVEINAIKSFHDGVRGKRRGENIIFKFRMDGIDVCHLGDLGEACSPELIELLLPVDVLLIPVGGNYTIDAATAKDYVERIMPNVVIPMHYRTRELKIDVDKPDEFLRLFDEEMIEESESCELELSRSDLGEGTRIIVLRRA